MANYKGKSKSYGNKRNNSYGRKPNRGRGNYNRSKDVERDIPRTEEKVGDINNPAYYYEGPTVLDQIMNFSFNQYGGVALDIHTDPVNVANYYNPMICTYYLNPSIPTTWSNNPADTSGATTAGLRNFMYLTSTNNRSIPYSSQDLLILQMAIGNMLSTSSHLTRCLGLPWLFNYRNREYPEGIFHAIGLDANDFNHNLADYRLRYNRLLTLASKIPFPANIPAFAKNADMFSNIYLDDEDSALAQTYILVPQSIWIFDEAYNTNGSGLRTTNFVDGTIRTFGDYLDLFEQQIGALLNSTSLNYIYSDILRLQQKGEMSTLLGFQPIPESYIVRPVYNAEVETWLHNAVIIGSPLATASQHAIAGITYTDRNDVSCDANNNKLVYMPQFSLPGDIGYEALIDFDHDNVSIEDKVRSTRFSVRVMPASDAQGSFTMNVALSDHYITKAVIFLGGTTINFTKSFLDCTSFTVAQLLTRFAALSKFDWAPILYVYHSSDVTTAQPIGDLDYYTTLDYHFMRRLYDYEVIHYYQIG